MSLVNNPDQRVRRFNFFDYTIKNLPAGKSRGTRK
jgi:hypothetical protein